MRIDDRLETALRNFDDVTPQSMSGQWHQLIDILAQNPRNFQAHEVAAGLTQLHKNSAHVPVKERIACLKALHKGINSAPLVLMLSLDEPRIAALALERANLSDEDWVEIIPRLNSRGRGFLRPRKDLGAAAAQALTVFSSGDFLLPHFSANASATALDKKPVIEPVSTWQAEQPPIGVIVERIEEWRRNRENAESPLLPFVEEREQADLPEITEFRFESNDNGTIIWVEGAPRGAIVGIDIAHAAYDNGPGPDAYGAAAFRQRMPMDSARMQLRGASVVEGEWRITAAPFFDAISGRFRGYRGILRRPTVAETAIPVQNNARQAEQMQQIVHELRTPLGAIAGFAEIIEQQLFGPVSAEYRDLAVAIIDDANLLLAGFDDLNIAAKIDSGQLDISLGYTDCSWLASRLKDRLHAISENMDVKVNLVVADPVRPYAVDPEFAERIFSRLLAAVIIGCRAGEELKGRFHTEIGATTWNQFKLDLPAQLIGQSEEDLLNSSPQTAKNPAGSPLLGLGFSLRLIRNLSQSVGGSLHIHKESLLLSLPASQDGHSHYKDRWGD